MKKIMRNSVATVLSITMILTTTQLDVDASECSKNNYSEEVYVDGEKFVITTNLDDGTVTVNSADKEDESVLVLSDNAGAEVKVYDAEEKDYEDYFLEIENLSDNDIDIDVIDESGNVIEEIDDYDDLIDDTYEGQMEVAIVTGITIEALITALLQAAACIAVAGVIYYAGKAVVAEIEKSKEQQKYYYKAYIYNKNVFINLANRISRASAISRIRSGVNIYTYKKANAKSVTVDAGLGVSSPDISCFSGKKVKFYHYHTSPKNNSHIFYGAPVIS